MIHRLLHSFLVFWGIVDPERWYLERKARELMIDLAELRAEHHYLGEHIDHLKRQLDDITLMLRIGD